jgi:hypothetical protein
MGKNAHLNAMMKGMGQASPSGKFENVHVCEKR